MSSSPTSLNASSWLANSQGQLLTEHCLAVAIQSLILFREQNFNSDVSSDESKEKEVVLAGLFHDLGKIDPYFQKFITQEANRLSSNSVEVEVGNDDEYDYAHPRHEEVSFALLEALVFFQAKESLKHTVYYHHAKARSTTYDVGQIINLVGEKSSFEIEDAYNYVIFFLEGVEKCASVIVEAINSSNQDYSRRMSAVKDTCAYVLNHIKKLRENLAEPRQVRYENFKAMPPGFFSPHQSVTVENLQDFGTAFNAWLLLKRSILISADRQVSAVSNLEVKMKNLNFDWTAVSVESSEKLMASLEKMEKEFPKSENINGNPNRSHQQEQAASDLAKLNGVAVLQGPAGCGKTKIGLQWLKNILSMSKAADGRIFHPKRLYVVVPRSVIAKNLYQELIKKEGKYKFGEYQSEVSVELITGDKKVLYKEGVEIPNEAAQFEGSIVILTIDQVVSMMFSHHKIDVLLDLLNSAVLFDEFHEFFDIPGMVVMFRVVLDALRLYKNPNVLLVSATPNPFFLSQLDIDGAYFTNISCKNSKPNNIIKIPSFNQSDFQIELNSYNDVKSWSMSGNKYSAGDVFIYNSATYAQNSALNALQKSQGKSVSADKKKTRKAIPKNNSKTMEIINVHSKFTPEHRHMLMDKIKAGWGELNEECCIQQKQEHQGVVFAGPIIQASLDISTGGMYTEECSAENMLQRLGRLNRFGKRKSAKFTLSVAGKTKAQNHAKKRWRYAGVLNQISSWSLFFQNKVKENVDAQSNFVVVTLKMLYEWYEEYHRQDGTPAFYQEDFNEVLKKSEKLIESNVLAPRRFYGEKSDQKILGSHSLRGASSYVVVPTVDLSQNKKSAAWLSNNGDDVQKHLSMSDQDIWRDAVDKKGVANHIALSHSTTPPADYDPYDYKLYEGCGFTFKGKEKKLDITEFKDAARFVLRKSKVPSMPYILNTPKNWENGWVYITYGNTPIGLMNYSEPKNNKGEEV